jgi:carbon monoxide dehydrogenase subunit G
MDVTVERTIACPRAEVAPFVMDNRNDTAWIGGIKESELLGEPPIREGSDVRRVASFLGRRIEYVLRIERLLPDAQLAMHSVKAPFPMTVTYGFTDDGAGTRVSIRVGGEAGGWYRMAESLLASRSKRSIASDLERLAGILERPGA